jgi:hypothetical protein
MGLEPLSPGAGDPKFDVAWRDSGGSLVVVEVKSATPTNLENQLRIGLGQVLRYGESLLARGERTRLALVTELAAVDPIWDSLLSRLEILSTTPEHLSVLFE